MVVPSPNRAGTRQPPTVTATYGRKRRWRVPSGTRGSSVRRRGAALLAHLIIRQRDVGIGPPGCRLGLLTAGVGLVAVELDAGGRLQVPPRPPAVVQREHVQIGHR